MISGIRTHITIGYRKIFRTPLCRIESIRHRPLSRAGIVLPDPSGAFFRSIACGEAVEIRLGYRYQAPAVWQGTVAWVQPGTTDQIEVGAVGMEKPLDATRIVQSWVEETPEAIIRWAIGQAGLAAGRIDSPAVVLPRFAASGIPVWQVARQCAHTCQKAFGLDMSRWAIWMGADGKVNWGDFDESGDVPVVATGEGLIRHLPATCSGALNRVETFLLAGFTHSRRFRLIDTRRGIDENLRALAVRHEVKPRSVRTVIEYGEEYARF